MVKTERYASEMGEITHFTLTNSSGAQVTLSTLGAGIVAITVPDRDGCMADVVLGYKNPLDYIGDGPCAGKIPGRYANRIARGRFRLDGREYTLAVNCGPNSLHGGPTGFANRNWRGRAVADDTVEFSYRSADGEEGFPGNLRVKALYSWLDDNTLEVELTAVTDAPTVVNLTNHAYFNLDGHDAGSALDHLLRLNADAYLPTDDTLVPLGRLDPVEGTPMDFRGYKPLGRDIRADFPALRHGKGYDHCWALNDWEEDTVNLAAELLSPRSGRKLTVLTTQPGVQVYTGNWLTGSPGSKSGVPYTDYCAVAIECQGFPDAPNQPSFPTQRLDPGRVYRHLIAYTFSTAADHGRI